MLLLGARVGASAPIPPKSARGSTPRARSARRRRNLYDDFHANSAPVFLPQDLPVNPESKRWRESPMGCLFHSAVRPRNPEAEFEPEILAAFSDSSVPVKGTRPAAAARAASPFAAKTRGSPSSVPPLRVPPNTAPARVYKSDGSSSVKARTDNDITDDEVGAVRRRLAAEARELREKANKARARANAEARRRLREVGARTDNRIDAPAKEKPRYV